MRYKHVKEIPEKYMKGLEYLLESAVIGWHKDLHLRYLTYLIPFASPGTKSKPVPMSLYSETHEKKRNVTLAEKEMDRQMQGIREVAVSAT